MRPEPSDPRYPIGKYTYAGSTPELRREWITQIAAAPGELRAAVRGLTPAQLDTAYREGGWTVRQVVHHVADSHMNAYCRFRLALTETTPRIFVYDEKLWAGLADAASAPVELSLDLLDALHRRLSLLLASLAPADFERQLEHPVNGRMPLDRMLGLYAWHGRHHSAHITTLRRRQGW